jgi:hypothetical protein
VPSQKISLTFSSPAHSALSAFILRFFCIRTKERNKKSDDYLLESSRETSEIIFSKAVLKKSGLYQTMTCLTAMKPDTFIYRQNPEIHPVDDDESHSAVGSAFFENTLNY